MKTDKKIKAFLVDAQGHSASVVEVEDDLPNLYDILHCDMIDITVASVGATSFDIVCDDEGLLKSDAITTALDYNLDPVLVGSLLFCHHDEDGHLTSITDEDVMTLTSHMTYTSNVLGGKRVFQPAIICID